MDSHGFININRYDQTIIFSYEIKKYLTMPKQEVFFKTYTVHDLKMSNWKKPKFYIKQKNLNNNKCIQYSMLGRRA